jgi:soluble lytic murein transglycosylase-like protein
MPTPALLSLTKQLASAAGVDPVLACAVVEQESGWNQWAIRFEPAFETRYVDAMHLDPTETKSRCTSWGLMQLMGEVAREQGLKGFLSQLCDPETGLAQGLIHLKNRLKAAGGDVHKGLLLWNGGSDAAYPDQVLARMDKYR